MKKINLSERDRRILIILGAFFVLVAIYLIGSWAIGGGGSRSVAAKQAALSDILQLYRTFQTTQAAFDAAEKDMTRAGDFELLTELDNLALKAGVKENLVSIDKKSQPKNPYYEEEAVDVKLDRITIIQLMNYLYELEYSPKVIRVKEIHVEVRYDNKDQMNARLTVSKFSQNKSSGVSAPPAQTPVAAPSPPAASAAPPAPPAPPPPPVKMGPGMKNGKSKN